MLVACDSPREREGATKEIEVQQKENERVLKARKRMVTIRKKSERLPNDAAKTEKPQRRCRVCSKPKPNKFTGYYCEHCEVPQCAIPCNTIYHAQNEY